MSRGDPVLVMRWVTTGPGQRYEGDAPMESEAIVMRTHPKVLFGPILMCIVCCVAAAAAFKYVPRESLGGHAWLVIMVVLLVLLVGLTVKPLIRWRFSVYTLTPDQIVASHGMIWRTEQSMALNRVVDVQLERGLLDRLVGCGTIDLGHAGIDDGFRLVDVPHVKQVQQQISRAAAGHAPAVRHDDR